MVLVEEVPFLFQENEVSVHERVQNGFQDQDVPTYDMARQSHTNPTYPPAPPTYDEAIMVSMDEKLQEERRLNPGGW